MHKIATLESKRTCGGAAESGSALLIVLISLLATLLYMRGVFLNTQSSEMERKKIDQAINDSNDYRFIHQLIADDQLCELSDFKEGLAGWELRRLTDDKVLKNNGSFVNYSAISGAANSTWPTNPSNQFTDVDIGIVGGGRLVGKGKVTSTAFVQPRDRDILKSYYARVLTAIRVPISVRDVYTLESGARGINDSGGLDTYLELDPTGSIMKACYKSVSSRSICLDAGGIFDENGRPNKCKLPAR